MLIHLGLLLRLDWILEPEGTSRKRGITPDVAGRTPLIVLAANQSAEQALGG